MGWSPETQRYSRGEWAWWGYFLICSNVKTEEEEFLEKQNWIANGILRTDSVISGEKSLDSVLAGPSFYCDKWRVLLEPLLTTRDRASPATYYQSSHPPQLKLWLDQEFRTSASLWWHPGTIRPDLILRHAFVAVKTMLILPQSEQQIDISLAFRPLTCYCFVTRFHVCCLHLWKAPGSCSENSVIVIQRSLGNPMPCLGTVCHKRIWSNFMG